jgi:hypothetical protein
MDYHTKSFGLKKGILKKKGLFFGFTRKRFSETAGTFVAAEIQFDVGPCPLHAYFSYNISLSALGAFK